MRVSLILIFTACGLSALACGDDVMEQPDTGGQIICMQDDSLGPDSAIPLTLGEATTGFLCPVSDEDWYSFDLPAGQGLMRVELAIDNARSPVEGTYSVSPVDSPQMAVATPDGEEIEPGADLNDLHCVGGGSYRIVVRDSQVDAEDIRNEYTLRVTASPEPDAAEPNNEQATATPVSMGSQVSGYIACLGDVDVFQFEVGMRQAVQLSLTAPIVSFHPTVRIVDSNGDEVLAQTNLRGTFEETRIMLERQLEAGTYFAMVSDDDNGDADAEGAYTLTVGLFEDPDTNEPNDGPTEATMLGAANCGGSWSTPLTNNSGAIVTAADTDWFEVPVTGCAGGIVEAVAELNTAGLSNEELWQLQSRVQLGLTLVRSAPDAPCTIDDDCVSLPYTCEENNDCGGFFEACQIDGFCGGAAVCLPAGVCGANQTFRAYEREPTPEMISGPPPPNRVVLSAPIFGNGPVYIRVSDFQSDAGDTRARYNLTVRVRADPDAHEPDNEYYNNWIEIEDKDPIPTPLTIHNCTAGDCCGAGDFVTAHIGYEGDQDFFMGSHPCSGMDCMLRLHYQVGAGPVHTLFGIRTSQGRFYETSIDAGTSGTIGDVGGPVGEGQCILGYNEHQDTPWDFYVRHYNVEDELSTAYDPDQDLRFCLEITSTTCQAPCTMRGGQCATDN